MDRAGALQARLSELRQSFDRGFAQALSDEREETSVLLVIRVGRDAHAVRLADVAAVEARCAVTPAPSEHAELLGVAGLRAAVVAVFDLGALIGAPGGETRWLLLAKGAPVAFAFADFEGVLNINSRDVATAPTARGARVRDMVWRDGQPLPVIDIAGLVGDLEARPRRTKGEDGG